MAFYTGDKFPAWRGSMLVGALAGKLVSRLETNGDKVTGEERMLQNLGERIRDVRQGPDGFVYLLTDSPQGRVLRMRPASERLPVQRRQASGPLKMKAAPAAISPNPTRWFQPSGSFR